MTKQQILKEYNKMIDRLHDRDVSWVGQMEEIKEFMFEAIDKAVEERDKEIVKLNKALITCAMCDSKLFVACPKCGELTKPKP